MKQSNRFYQTFISKEVFLFHLNLACNECLRPILPASISQLRAAVSGK